MTMESSILSENVNNLTDEFDAIVPNEEGLFPNASIVIFHLDTTEWNVKIAEICQIAAWCKKQTFNEYLLPTDISPVITFENGFKIEKNGKLSHYNEVVNAVSPKDGLENFLNFLSGLTGKTRNILLAAHNCNSFHRHILVRILKYYNLFDEFKSLVLGFIDTIPVFKSILPDRKEKFGLEELANYCLNKNLNPQQKHAVVYVQILVSLIEMFDCNDAVMKRHVEELEDFIRFLELKEDFEKKLKDDLLWKIAKAGFTTNMLKDAYRTDPVNGVTKLLKGGDGIIRLKLQNATFQNITVKVSEICAEDENVGNDTA